MRTAQVSELKERLDEVIEAVRNGETVEIREGERALAEVVPMTKGIVPSAALPDQTALEAHLDELVRQGKARRGTGTFPADFFTRPLPKAEKSVLEALLEDRHSD
jgi:antitoxin (DNA-binding transcriptional repressor) of toxin-antitoxin stability system